MGIIKNILGLFRKRRKLNTIIGNKVRLDIGLQHAGDESESYGSYKVVGGRVKRDKKGMIRPITEKATIIYKERMTEASWAPGEVTVYKIFLYKNYNGKTKMRMNGGEWEPCGWD